MASAEDGLRLKTVVIDPGHGGHDPGAVSKDKKNYEKTFVLDISRRLADRIRGAYPDVKVILTRDSDEFVSLDGRASIANRADANLFISIHINSSASSSPNGYSIHLLGQSSNKNRDLFAYNMDVCRLENSVILLEEDATKYEEFDPDDPESQIFAVLMQSANLEQGFKFAEAVSENLAGGPIKSDRGIWQNPFYVLWKTSMPAVLVELGFISNQTDLAALRLKDNREDIADRLFKAFVSYKCSYEGTEQPLPPAASEPAEKVKETAPEMKEEEKGILYGVQIFALSRILPEGSKEFLGYRPTVIKAGAVNKYIIGVKKSADDAKEEFKKIKTKYPDSYLVKIKDGKCEKY